MKTINIVNTTSSSISNQTKEDAAKLIQKYWKGFKVRNLFSPPSNPYLNVSSCGIPVGNDPISHLEEYVKIKKHPAILVTGGVQCLYNAINLTMKPDAKLGLKPKIFVMDHNESMIQFWKLIKVVFNNSCSIESFLEKLPKYKNLNVEELTMEIEFGYPESLTYDKSVSRWLMDSQIPFEMQKLLVDKYCPLINNDQLHPRELYKFFSDLIGSNESRFVWLKSIVTNHLYLIKNCWVNSQDGFKFIKRIKDHHDYDMFVYASNIEDCNPRCSNKLWENISILEPSMVVKSISARSADGKGYPYLTRYIDDMPKVAGQGGASDAL